MADVVTHTPGPWAVNTEQFNTDRKKREGVAASIESAEWFVADVWGDFEVDEDDPDGPPRGTALANARLIAAAPDLLVALKETFAICETVMLAALTIPELDTEANAISDAWMLKAKELGIPDGFLDRAQAAIAKAEGR